LKLALLQSVLTPENRMLMDSAKKQGVALDLLLDSQLELEITNPKRQYDGILQRSSSYARTLYSSFYLEQCGTFVCNPYKAHYLCGDKFLASTLLAKAGIPTPRTFGAFSADSARAAAAKLGFPVVMKPVFGSWARMVHRLNDADALSAELESREEMGHAFQKVYYLQEHIDKPGCDIRAIVVGQECISAVYRVSAHSSQFITNTSRGGTAQKCELTSDLEELCVKASLVFGEGIYGVDLMETPESSFVVHEVNHTAEFHKSIAAAGVDIPGKMVEYFVKNSKK
jgi:[lysine-biosynthesis-protein LysW]---L-2-aminoadipate ligase